MRRVLQLTGAGAVVAGVSWAVAAVLHSMQPEGCVGQGCLSGGPMRGSTPTTDVVFVLAGIMLVVLGLVVLAVVVWRSRVLPRGLVVAVLLTALLLPLANEQTRLVLLAVPFGLAWAAAGVWLLASGGRPASSGAATLGPGATGAEPHTSTQATHR